MGPFEAAREATADIGLAVLATTLSLVVVFVPVSFMSSVSGRFLYQFGLTAGVSVMVSLLVSFTLTPMMSARLLRAEDVAAGGGHDPGMGHVGARGQPSPHRAPLPRSERIDLDLEPSVARVAADRDAATAGRRGWRR